MATCNDVALKSMVHDGVQVKKWIHNGVEVFSAVNTVTYYMSYSEQYVEEREEGADCLTPTTFTPAKDGWTFAGWSEERTATATALAEKKMGSDDIVLYALFTKEITLTYYDDNETGSFKDTAYYNSYSAVQYPSFTLSQLEKEGWSMMGWYASPEAPWGMASSMYENGVPFTLMKDTTLYGAYSRYLTVAYYNNSSMATYAMLTMTYNSSGDYYYPAITPTQVEKEDWTAMGWATSGSANATALYANGESISIMDDVTVYGLYEKPIVLTYDGNGADSGSMASFSQNARYNSSGKTAYPSFTLVACGFTKAGYEFVSWDIGEVGDSIELTEDTTAKAVWSAV